ncbi:MAG: type II secretion system GspH family protein [Candidatus Omnitrophica bacterium]|nr:type II secretion system GspH family protein [Candidatus Omnitrophota bacterium]
MYKKITNKSTVSFIKPIRGRSLTGFTLVEVITALVVFVIGVVSLFPLLSDSFKMLADIETKIDVANVARSKMAEIETQGFNNLPLAAGEKTGTIGTYSFSVTDTPIAQDIVSNNDILYEIQLIISWQGRSGTKSETFVTYIGKM